MDTKVLLVDDEENILNGLKRRFHRQFNIDIAKSAADGLSMLEHDASYAVVISDQNMPGMNGTVFLKKVLEDYPYTARIMLTGLSDQKTTLTSVNECQVFRYLKKPCSLDTLSQAIEDGIAHYKTLVSERDLLQRTIAGSVKLLVDMLAVSNPENFNHINQLRKLASYLSRDNKTVNAWELDMTIMLSPIGRMALPSELRARQKQGGELSHIEHNLLASAPKVAHDLLLNIPRMKSIANAIFYQDKTFDGAGYPVNTVKGYDIPLNARILFLLKRLTHISGAEIPTPENFQELEKDIHLYDPKLFEYARNRFAKVYQSEQNQTEELKVMIDGLRPGDVLVEDLKTENGKLALAAQNELTDTTLKSMITFHEYNKLVEPVCVLRSA
ncbi:MAG: HD domain-containing phosphohydrolase [Pseudomonadota bacterium]